MTEAARIAAGGSDTRLRSPPAAWRSPERIAYWAILACGIAARCVYFGQIPDGVHVDEATGAVDGYAIFHFGTDRWNNVFPAEFPGHGTGAHAMAIYANALIVGLLGLNIYSARLFVLLCGIAALPVACHVAERMFGRTTGLVAMALLAVLPWQIVQSRWGQDAFALPLVLLVGLALLHKGLSSDGGPLARWTACVPWALTPYVYKASILAVLVFAPLVILSFRRELAREWRSWLGGASAGLIIALPQIAFRLKNDVIGAPLAVEPFLPFSLPLLPSSRVAEMGPFGWRSFGKNVLFLTSTFRDGLATNQSTFFVPLSPFIPFFGLVGLAAIAVDGERWRRGRLLLFLVLAYLPSLLVFEQTADRMNGFILGVALAAAEGLVAVAAGLRERWLARAFAGCAGISVLAYSAIFFGYYITEYNTEISWSFSRGMREAFAAAVANARPGERIWVVKPGSGMPYIYPLFFDPGQIDSFRKTAVVRVNERRVYEVSSFGRFVFGDDPAIPAKAGGVVYLAPPWFVACGQPEILRQASSWTVGRCPG